MLKWVSWLLGCLWLCAWSGSTLAQNQTIDHAQASFQLSPSSAANITRHIKLPDSWEMHDYPPQGEVEYLMDLDYKPGMDDHLAIYVPRMGNRFALYINEQWIGASGDLGNIREDHVNQPHIFYFSSSLLSPSLPNQLRILIQGEKARNAGLSLVYFGPEDAMEKLYRKRDFWQIGGALVIVTVSFAIGIMSLGFGLTMGSTTLLVFAGATLLWVLRNSYVFLTQPIIPFPWWGGLIDLSYSIAVNLLLVSALMVLRRWRSWMLKPVIAYQSLILLLVSLHVYTGEFIWKRLWLLALVILVVGAGCYIILYCLKKPTLPLVLLAASAMAGIGFGIYDHWALRYSPQGYGNFDLSRFAVLIMAIAMSVVLMRRAMRAILVSKRLRRRFAARLERARKSLAELHSLHEQEQVKQATLEERIRIMRDMHDGLGSQLVGLLGMAHHTGQFDLESQVKHAIDELRFALDNLHGVDTHWFAVIADLRDRIEPRLVARNIALVWEICPFAEAGEAKPRQVTHFRLLMMEINNNILKHADASKVVFRADVTEFAGCSCLHICVSDNGKGFDPQQMASGYGLNNLRERATALGAELQWCPSVPSGMQVDLYIPLNANPSKTVLL